MSETQENQDSQESQSAGQAITDDDFAAMLEEYGDAPALRLNPGDRAKATVVHIGDESVFCSLSATQEGTLERIEVTDDDERIVGTETSGHSGVIDQVFSSVDVLRPQLDLVEVPAGDLAAPGLGIEVVGEEFLPVAETGGEKLVHEGDVVVDPPDLEELGQEP